MNDTFRGDNANLIASINALLELDAEGALVPHGVGGHARALLSAAASRLAAPAPVIADTAGAKPGWKPVPVDPDHSMIGAGARAVLAAWEENRNLNSLDTVKVAYAAMLEAAPSPAIDAAQDDSIIDDCIRDLMDAKTLAEKFSARNQLDLAIKRKIESGPAIDTAGEKPVAWKWNQGGILYREDAPDEHNAWKWTPLFDSPAIDAAPVRDAVEAWDAYFTDRTNEQAAVRFVLAMNKLRETLNRPATDAAPYSAPFTTDVPQCCGDPGTCNDPCAPAIHTKGASEARDKALSELYDMVYEECYFMDFRKRVIELLAQGVLK